MNYRKTIRRLVFLSLFAMGGITIQAQSVTKEFKETPLSGVLKEVEKQTGFSIMYNNDDLSGSRAVTRTFEDASIEEVLKAILPKNLEFRLQDKMIVIFKKGCQGTQQKPTKKISGIIVDAVGEPVIGANVLVKGTTNGVITDIDGNYTLNDVPTDAVISISYIGYQPQEFKASSKELAKVVLTEDSEMLDEVVVVGYGVQKKSSVTGAIASVKSEDLENRTASNALQALQGKTAGVNISSSGAAPGSSSTVRIRGIGSNGDCPPLYVVDGRIASDINGIDPNDIESIEVLKDAASAAIYGAQAGNGVILVTTKKGKGKGTITYNLQLASQSVAKTPKVMNSEQYIDYYTEKGNFSMEDVYRNWDFKTNTDWNDVAFENSLMQRHNITFSGAGERGSFYVSGSYLSDDGIVKGNKDKYQRFTGMINANYKVKDWIEVGVNTQIEYYKASFVSEYNNSGIYGNMFLGVLQLDPLTRPLYGADELPQNMKTILRGYQAGRNGELLGDGNGNYYGISSFSSSDNLNPLLLRDKGINQRRGHGINGMAYLNLTPTEGLVITSRLGYALTSYETYSVDFDYYANAQAFQNFVKVSASNGSPTSYQWENFINYTRDFGQHNVNVMLGTSFSESRTFGLDGSYRGTDGDLGFQQDNPLYWYFAYATGNAIKELSGGEAVFTRKNSYFGRASWNYADKYYAQFSLRVDAADLSVLPKPKRWGYFPAVSGGWVISEEKFMQSTASWLTHLKLRASWGQNGSTASLSNYAYLSSIASVGNYPFSNDRSYTIGNAPTSTGNEELKWETSEQIDLGVDARFLRNRLTFSVDYFKKKTKDLIVSGITPSTVVGNTASPINAGNIENSGFEFELGWQDNIGDFRYGIRANLATLKNKVTYLHPSLTEGINGTSFPGYATITKFEIGQPAWYFYGYEYTGVDKNTGDPTFADRDGNGSIGDNDKTYIGKSIPDFTYGITLTASYKGFDAIVFGSGSQGNDIFSCLNREDYAINKLTHFTEDRWSASNPNGHNPRAAANEMSKYAVSSANVFDGSYFKIKQIQLGYTLPKKAAKYVLMDNVRAYVSLEDFFTFSSYVGFDPETTTIDMGSYPTSKKVVFGLNVTF